DATGMEALAAHLFLFDEHYGNAERRHTRRNAQPARARADDAHIGRQSFDHYQPRASGEYSKRSDATCPGRVERAEHETPGATSTTRKIYRLPPQPPPASVPLGPESSLLRAWPAEFVRDTNPSVPRARQRFTRTGTSASTPRAASAPRS